MDLLPYVVDLMLEVADLNLKVPDLRSREIRLTLARAGDSSTGRQREIATSRYSPLEQPGDGVC